MSNPLDTLAHIQDRRIREIVSRLENSIREATVSIRQVVDGTLAPESATSGVENGAGAAGTTGVDYSQTPPALSVAYADMEERLDNLDTHLGLRFVHHAHDGIDSERIPASSVLVPAALTGSGANQTLEEFIGTLGGRSACVVYGACIEGVPLVSMPEPDRGVKAGLAACHRGRLAFSGGWQTLFGAIGGLQNIRRPDGSAFDLASLVFRERSVNVLCALGADNLSVSYDVATRWVHAVDPNVPDTALPVHLVGDLALLLMGW